jgi:predicted enzyme related to lactoylglutathione lyase
MINVILTSIPVQDQEKALAFYTHVLGFTKKEDIAMGDYRWLTVVGTSNPVEIVLEPMAFPPARDYQQALFAAGIPINAFGTDDIQAEYVRLMALGVKFHTAPTNIGPVILSKFEDGCGNLLQLVQKHPVT